MTQFLAIVSGKGGTGKTTTAINLGTALAQSGREVIVVDGNLHNPNIALRLGNPLLPITMYDVSKGKKGIKQAAYSHPSGLKIIPGSIIDEIEKQDFKRVEHSFLDLVGAAELVIIDTAAQAHDEIIRAADKLLIVTTPDLTAVTDTLRAINRHEAQGSKILGVVVNQTKGKHEMPIEEIQSLLGKPILGNIPYDEQVDFAHTTKHPVTYLCPNAKSSQSFKKLAYTLIGHANQ